MEFIHDQILEILAEQKLNLLLIKPF